MRSIWAHAAVRRWVFGVVFAASLVGIVVSNAVPLWYRFHGERLLVVTSGSMEPRHPRRGRGRHPAARRHLSCGSARW